MKLYSLILAGAFVVAAPAADLKTGIAAYESHDYAAAENEFKSVISAEPENATAYAYLALVLAEKNSHDAAAEQARKASELAADSAEARVAMARVQAENGDSAGARRMLDEAVSSNGDDALALYQRGQLRLKDGDYKGAAADLDRAAELRPSLAYAYYYAGLAYSKLNQPDRMVERYQTFMKMKPDAPETAKIRALLRGVR
jgi:tetratricopeptide (TPR) repeat protein